MATDSWTRSTDRHIRAPWDRSEAALCRDLHGPASGSSSNGLYHIWKYSQQQPRMDFGHHESAAVEGHPRQWLSLSREELFRAVRPGSNSGHLPSTNPYFSGPYLNHTVQFSIYGSSLQLPGVLDVPDDPVPPLRTPPPWADTSMRATISEDITNPYLPNIDPVVADPLRKYQTPGGSNSSGSSPDQNNIRRHRGSNNMSENISKINAIGMSKERKQPGGGIAGFEIGRSVSAKNLLDGKPMGHLSRSRSFDRQCFVQKYTKARSLAEEVIENLVRQMVCDQCRPNLVADMIFRPSNLCRPRAGLTHDGNVSTRLLIQRILLLQLQELSPMLMHLASNDVEFQNQGWALRHCHTNGQQIEEQYPNQGLRFLCLQQKFMEIGMETFDFLWKLRSQIPRIASEDGSQGTGILPIAVVAGDPGCSALGLHLFFLRLCPSLQIQTDLVAKDATWKEIVEAICVRGLGMVCMSLMEVITKHPTCLRSYRLIFFINVLGELYFQDSVGQWDLFWNNLYQRTSAMVLVVIRETNFKWEEMKPKKGLWWFGSVQGDESVHIIRKV